VSSPQAIRIVRAVAFATAIGGCVSTTIVISGATRIDTLWEVTVTWPFWVLLVALCGNKSVVWLAYLSLLAIVFTIGSLSVYPEALLHPGTLGSDGFLNWGEVILLSPFLVRRIWLLRQSSRRQLSCFGRP
jgi:hypothetical protein